MDRRSFFQFTAGTAVATLQGLAVNSAFAAPASTAGRTPEQMASDEDFWAAVRNEFTTDRTVVNLNNGYASPAPRTATPTARPGVALSRSAQRAGQVKAANQRLAREGSIEAGAAMWKNFL